MILYTFVAAYNSRRIEGALKVQGVRAQRGNTNDKQMRFMNKVLAHTRLRWRPLRKYPGIKDRLHGMHNYAYLKIGHLFSHYALWCL